MRDIKFRAWNKDTKKMYKVGQITLEKGIWDFEPDNKEHIGMSIPYQPSFVLMQYTGLKDRNQVEIYEGDIVKSFYYITNEDGTEVEIYDIKEIKYDEILCKYNIDKFDKLEVIGNIYDNPNLLKKESD